MQLYLIEFNIINKILEYHFSVVFIIPYFALFQIFCEDLKYTDLCFHQVKYH